MVIKKSFRYLQKNLYNKKSISLTGLFTGFPNELIFIYKNAIKLEFSEEQDYELYIILLNNRKTKTLH